MRLSFEWLSDYVDLSGLSAQEVAERLTMGAFEVEDVRRVGPDIEGPLVVGEIVEINPHPNADKIRLTRVKIDPKAEALEIVCGADNIIVGQRVPVALPGARVINRHDGTALPIARTKIRGVVSNGMLCSPPELGLSSQEGEGILILYGGPPLGTDVKQLLNLYPDWVLHVEPRSNRGDALCVLGLAREVAALCGRSLTGPRWRLPEEDVTSQQVPIEIEDLEDCPYFSIRVLEGIKVGPSPLRILRRLEAVGVRPVNNVVDITNYVLHELGQPLHAYDLGKIHGPLIKVRRAAEGEKLTTIDGRERVLNEEILSIADLAAVVGVAGVMGGKASEVTEDTTFIALEAAAFHSARVRRASRLIGLSSESSLRFERGVDVASVRKASDRAAQLMLESCGGFLGKFTFAGSDEVSPIPVRLRLSQLKRLAELELTGAQVSELLTPLGFALQGGENGALTVCVPSFRQGDVRREIDLVEEVCRLWGYERIPASMPKTTAAPEPPDRLEPAVREALSASGLVEAWISSLTALDPLGDGDTSVWDEGRAVKVLNPLSDDHQVLRQSLLPGLIRAVAYNQDRGRTSIWLFEIGRVYERSGTASEKDPGARERLHVGAAISGQQLRSYWDRTGADEQPETTNYYQMKGIVESLAERIGLPVERLRFYAGTNMPRWFHPGRSCRIEIEQNQEGSAIALGHLGEIHPAVADAVGIRSAVHLFELDLDVIRQHRRPRQFAEIFNTPSVTRDITVDLEEDVEHDSVQRVIRRSAGQYLRSLELVSVFRLKEGWRSLTYRLTFQNPEQTLTSEEVDRYIAAVREELTRASGAQFR